MIVYEQRKRERKRERERLSKRKRNRRKRERCTINQISWAYIAKLVSTTIIKYIYLHTYTHATINYE